MRRLLQPPASPCCRLRFAAIVLTIASLTVPEALGQVATQNQQQTPSRRVRRRYDARVQLYSLEDTAAQQVPVEKKEEIDNTESSLRLDAAPSMLKSGATPGPAVVPAPRLRPRAEDDEGSLDNLWITSSVSTILGVNMSRTNSFISGDWGWLARDAQKVVNTNRVARAQQERRKESDGDTAEDVAEENEAENVAARGAPLIISPQPAATPIAPVTSGDPSRHSIRFALELSADWESSNTGLAGTASHERPSLVRTVGTEQSSTPASAAAPTPPPELTESRRRIEELSSSHRPEGWKQPQTPNSAELARVPLDSAATVPSMSASELVSRSATMDRPLLSGSPENYGRRGDIFSPSFRSSSLESGALPAPLWGRSDSSGFAPPPAVQPTPSSNLPSVRSTGGFSGVDLLKPFDPAGRAVTEPRKGW